MSEFKNLIQIERMSSEHKPDLKKRGCDNCPLDKVKGINKVMGKVRGRKIFIWAQSPGMQENREKRELIGPAGQFLWYELKKYAHIERDMCDIQNVVRCVPADRRNNIYPPLQMRSPSKEEIKCCSIYNDRALEHSKAKLHLVFGKIAAQAVLGREFKNDKRVFYSEKMKTWVVYLDHPAYFIRQGYSAGTDRQPSQSLVRFREDLKHVRQLLKNKSNDRFQFLKDQNYIGITTRKSAREAYRKLVRAGKHGHRLVADMEEGYVDKHGQPKDEGRHVALCCGFAAKSGTSYTFALDHPDSPASKECRRLNRKLVRRLLRNPDIKKSFHYGPYDSDAIKRLLAVEVQGYDYDTLIGEFFRDPNAKAYGLARIADRRYPDFMGYKDIRYPEAFSGDYAKSVENKKTTASQKVEQADKQGKMNLARLPWKKMVVYNGADCHLEKLVEDDTVKYVNQPLMSVYVDSGHILYRMQHEKRCQPTFDYKWYKKIAPLYDQRDKELTHKLKKLAGKYAYIPNNDGVVKKHKFNSNSPQHLLWLLYDKMKVPVSDRDGKNTRAGTLLRIGLKYPKARYVVASRRIKKVKSTYLDGYYNCANLNDGRLRTNWKQTGTRTGRLSSGRTQDRSNDAVINFQNVHGDELIKCLMVSDDRWWELYEYWKEHGDFDEKSWRKFEDFDVELGADFSQHELRCLAQKSGCKELIKIFASKTLWKCDVCGEMHKPDPHVEVGHALTGWSKGKIYHDERVRKLVKNMQFGLVYGLQGEGLYYFLIALGVETTRKEVDKYHKKYFKRFPEVKEMQKEARDITEKTGYCSTMTGLRRKLMVEEQKEEGDEREGHAWWGNQAVNSPIQGTAHHILLMSLAMLWRNPKKYKYLQHVMKEIHDALYNRLKLRHLFRAVKEQAYDMLANDPVRILRKEFKLDWTVPLAVKFKAGFRFGVLVELEDKIKNEWEFLNAWCRANQKFHKEFRDRRKEPLKAFMKRELEIA